MCVCVSSVENDDDDDDDDDVCPNSRFVDDDQKDIKNHSQEVACKLNQE